MMAELRQYANTGASVEKELEANGGSTQSLEWHDQYLDLKD